MAITRTALGISTSKSGIGVINFNAGDILVGDMVILLVASDTGIASAIAVTISGTNYSRATVLDAEATSSAHVVTSILRVVNNIAYPSGGQISVNGAGASDSFALVGISVRGLATSAFDKSSTGTGSSTTPSSGATAALSQTDEIAIGAIGTEGPDGDTAGSWSNSFNAGQRVGTTGGSASSNVTISEGYLIVSATTALTAAKTGITSRSWAGAIATYNGAAAASLPNGLTITQAVKRASYY